MVSLFSSRSSPRCKLLLLTTSSPPDQGFTMFEVLVALMMSFLFLTGTLNAMVVSAIFQVKAERQAQASYWIQENLEEVRAAAANYVVADFTAAATTGQTCSNNLATVFNGDSTNGLGSVAIGNTRELVGADHRIIRSALPTATADPGQISQLTYTVFEDLNNNGTQDTNEKTLAELYTEILPAAALDSSCT